LLPVAVPTPAREEVADRDETLATSVSSAPLRVLGCMALGLTARFEPASAAAGYIEATVVDCAAATGFLSLT
jgi:preprotein translocase subunit SecF